MGDYISVYYRFLLEWEKLYPYPDDDYEIPRISQNLYTSWWVDLILTSSNTIKDELIELNNTENDINYSKRFRTLTKHRIVEVTNGLIKRIKESKRKNNSIRKLEKQLQEITSVSEKTEKLIMGFNGNYSFYIKELIDTWIKTWDYLDPDKEKLETLILYFELPYYFRNRKLNTIYKELLDGGFGYIGNIR